MKSRLYGLSLIVLLAVFSLCTACASPTASAAGGSQIPPTLIVKSVEIVMLESFPVQVHAVVTGELSDDCSRLSSVTPQRDITVKTFRIELTPERTPGVTCAEAPTSFNETFALDAVDLPAGAYTVEVNGVKAVFVLAVDNTLAPEGATAQPDTSSPAVDMTGWVEYVQVDYDFAFRMPPDWSLEEVQGPDNTMAGHQVKLHSQPEPGREVEMLISFKRTGEEQLIWPTGVGNGEFVARGTALLMGQTVDRNVLVCEGRDVSVYYRQEGGVRRGDLEFAVILRYVGNCADGYTLSPSIQSLVDQILASFEAHAN